LLLTLATPFPVLAAQTVVGQVVDQATGGPVGEGFVVLLDEQGREVARALAAADGRFTLHAARPGAYRLRSERIGYVAFVSPPITVADGLTVTQRLAVGALGVELAPIVVTQRSSCQTRPDREQATAAVWEEIRKALAAAAWTASQRVYQYRAATYERDWDLARRRPAREVGDTQLGYSLAPFVSAPPGELAERGYIVPATDGVWYYAPDATVLQDSTFLATHCFALVRRSSPGEGGEDRLVGLSFEPVPHRPRPDVKGVLWLDERTSELRAVEYGYTRIPDGVDNERIGGTVEFLKLPSGAWIVHQWQIRMPRLAVSAHSGMSGIVERQVVLQGFHDRGGQVLEIRAADGTVLYRH